MVRNTVYRTRAAPPARLQALADPIQKCFLVELHFPLFGVSHNPGFHTFRDFALFDCHHLFEHF